MKKDGAVSEIVGAILLVALVIMGIGIVAVLLTSTPPPQSKDKAVLSSSCIDCTGDSFAIVIRHEGGDVIDPRLLTYWLVTEYPNKTPFERFQVGGDYFYSAEKFSGLSRDDLCEIFIKPFEELKGEPIEYGDATTMKNGDVAVIGYRMKQS